MMNLQNVARYHHDAPAQVLLSCMRFLFNQTLPTRYCEHSWEEAKCKQSFYGHVQLESLRLQLSEVTHSLHHWQHESAVRQAALEEAEKHADHLQALRTVCQWNIIAR